jgi:hypothetical protein
MNQTFMHLCETNTRSIQYTHGEEEYPEKEDEDGRIILKWIASL